MAGYDPQVIRAFERAAQKRHAGPKSRKALFEAGIVESGLRNLNHGDRDSQGALQQRPSQGWKNARDPYRGALDFLDRAIPLAGKYGSAGQLAQAVQRSAYPGRYDQAEAQARSAMGRGSTSRGTGGSLGTVSRLNGQMEPDVQSALMRVIAGDLLNDRPMSPSGLALELLKARSAKPTKTTLYRSTSRSEMTNVSGGPNYHRPRVAIVDVGRLAQSWGLHVGENPHFGGVNPVHAPHSYHYQGRAIDVSGSPQKMAQFAHYVAQHYGQHVAELIYSGPGGSQAIKNGKRVNGPSFYGSTWIGHRNHVHIAI